MKKFLGILVLGLFLIVPSQADDIRDFQIEGMSVGDSLLDYINKEDRKKKKFSYKNKKYAYFTLIKKFETYERIKKFETYEKVSIHFVDKTFIMHAIAGWINFDYQIDKCLAKKESIINDIKKTLNLEPTNEYVHKYDNSRLSLGLDVNFTSESTSYVTDFKLISGDYIRVWCDNFTNEVKDAKNWADGLKVQISLNEYIKWLQNESHK